MNPTRKFLSTWWIYPTTAFVLLLASACNSGPLLKKTEEKPAEQNSAPVAQNTNGPGIDLNCVFDRLRNPTEAFHYSYSWHGQFAWVTQEVDVTPQSIDGTVNSMREGQTNPPEPVHAVRSNSDGWRTEVNHLSMGFGMASTFALVNHSSAMMREGTERVNGYDTTRYSIDTARVTGRHVLYDNTLGRGGFEKGNVWVTGTGCPVKISLDTGRHSNDGSISKDHYEEAMIKK